MAARLEHEKRRADAHPLFREAAARLEAGALDRRSFLRLAGLLGVPAAAAAVSYKFAGGALPALADQTATPASARAGGALRCAMAVHPLGDPAVSEWVEPSNQFRHQYEYLTITGADNVTRPMLARRWSASDDLKTWTFELRPGVRWRSGAPFTAEDVAWNVARWLDPALGSSNASLLAPLKGDGAGVEVVDPLTLRLHLATPMLALPESLYNYPAAILPQSFEGDPVADRNGTGPYQIVENAAGERSVSRRVAEDGWRYWGAEVAHIGPGRLDEIVYTHSEPGDPEAAEALARGEIDLVHEVDVDALDALAGTPGARLIWADSALTGCMRMKTTVKPFDDPRVRRAVQLCCDPQAYLARVFGGRGRLGAHTHVAPIHPEHSGLPAPARDAEAARRLLAEAGHPKGLRLTLQVGNTSGAWQERACRILAEQAKAAGIRIKVELVSAETYRKIWKTTPFGLTQWVHRPLGTMALSLGYRSGAPWNETGYADPAFDAALARAEALLDISERRRAMETVEATLQNAAVMAQPFWAPVFLLARERVKGLEAQPAKYHHFNRVWLDA